MFGLFKRKEPHHDAMQAIEKFVDCDWQFIRSAKPRAAGPFNFGVDVKVIEAHWKRLDQCLESSSEARNAYSMVGRELFKYGILERALSPAFVGLLLTITVHLGDAKPAVASFMETFSEGYGKAKKDGHIITFVDSYFPKDEHLMIDIPRRMTYVDEYVRRWREAKTEAA